MISLIPAVSFSNNYQSRNNIVAPSFQGKDVISRYVKPVENKHLPLLDKLQEFFTGVAKMLKAQQKTLKTQSGSLNVSNIAEPIPQAVIQFDKLKSMTVKPKKFKAPDGTRLDLCHFEFDDSKRISKFDVISSDNKASSLKGNIFAYNNHRADKHPIRENEQESVNKIFDRYSLDIINIIKKYQKKLS